MVSKTHYLSQEYRRLIFSKTFGFLIVVVVAFLLYPFLYEISIAHGVRNTIFYYTNSAFWTRDIVILIVMTTALICKSIPDDLNFGMVRYIVSRIHREHYIYLKCLALLFAVLTLTILSNIVRLAVVYTITRFPVAPVDTSQFVYQIKMNGDHLLEWGLAYPILFYIRKVIVTSLFISVWVLLGAIISAKYSNIYLTLSFPAMVYYLVINLFSSLFKIPYIDILSLKEDDLHLGSFYTSLIYPIIFFLLINVLLYFLLTMTLRRRVHEL